jgi:nicotinamide/nicotinate riboside kinase
MVIGIGGCSRSGKTTLANDLVWHFRNQNQQAMVLRQDDFVKRVKDIPLIRDEIDWECPASIDFELLKEAINFFRTRFEVVIVEGILVFADSSLNTLFDRTFFVEISEATFRTRKAADTRWGKIPDWFVTHIWQSYQRYGLPPAHLPNMSHVSGEVKFEVNAILTH